MREVNSTDSAELRRYGVDLLRGRLTRLRTLDEDDLPLLSRWWNDPEVMVLQQARALPQRQSSTEDLFRSWSAPSKVGFGFTEEGRRRAAVFHHGAFHDEILLGMLRDEHAATVQPN